MKSMRDSRREIRLIAAAFGLLFAVSLYRQLSIRFLPGDVIRPFVVFAVYVFLLGGWLHSIALRITQRFMLRCLRIEFSVMLIVMRVCLIYSRTRSIAQKKHRKVLPMLVGIAIPVIVVPYIINSFVVNFEVIEFTAMLFFLEAMFWESCIMIGLVPVNTNYRTVFEQSTVGMRIIDSSGQTKISSTYAKELTPQELSELLENGSLTSDPTQYLYLHKLSEGELIYQQDVSDINILINELEQVSEELRQENTLLAKELNSRSEQIEDKEFKRLITEWSETIRGMQNFEQHQSISAEPELLKVANLIGCKLSFTREKPSKRKSLLLLYSAVREALTNAVRHGNATSLDVICSKSGGMCRMFLRNNGTVPESRPIESGGLKNLRQTLEQEGAALDYSLSEGFALIISIPEIDTEA